MNKKLSKEGDALHSIQKSLEKIESLILNIRGKQVMLDRDLARLYGVETKVLNQAVKRNIERFPERFMFQLTGSELIELVTNCDRFVTLKHSTSSPKIQYVPFLNELCLMGKYILFNFII